VCVAALWLKLQWHRRDIELNVETEFVSGTLANAHDLSDVFQATAIHAERLSTILAPGLDIPTKISSDMTSWFTLEGPELTLRTLQLGKKARLQLKVEPYGLRLRVGEGELRGRIMASGRLTLSAGPDLGIGKPTLMQRDTPEALDFEVTSGDVPSEFRVDTRDKWVLTDLPFRNLEFVEQRITGAEKKPSKSSVRSGSLKRKDDPASEERLFKGERVAVQCRNARVELRGEGNLIAVNLSGTVDGVRIQGSEWNISVLQYLANNKSGLPTIAMFATVCLLVLEITRRVRDWSHKRKVKAKRVRH
jgi:hypothetical protein